MKSILPSGPLKTKLLIINYNKSHNLLITTIMIKANLQIVIIIKDLKNSSILPSIPSGPRRSFVGKKIEKRRSLYPFASMLRSISFARENPGFLIFPPAIWRQDLLKRWRFPLNFLS